jgi:hypothetical protein
MANRKSRNSTRSSSSRNSQEVEATEYRQAAQQRSQEQMAAAADAASAVIRGAEMWSQLQLNAVQRTGQSWREAAEKIRAAQGPLELVGVQNQLLMNAFVSGMQLAQEFVQASFAMQLEAGGQRALQGAAQAEPRAAGPTDMMAAMPMMQVWQAMMNPARANGAAGAVSH